MYRGRGSKASCVGLSGLYWEPYTTAAAAAAAQQNNVKYQHCQYKPLQPSSSEPSEQSTTPLHSELLVKQRRSGRHSRPPDFSHALGDDDSTPASAVQIHIHIQR